jgi:hypothetical protein
MANTLILKKSAVPGKTPTVGDLQYGELALNYADGNLFYKDPANSVQTLSNTLDQVLSKGNVSIQDCTVGALTAVGGVNSASVSSSGTLTLSSGANSNIVLSPNGSGGVVVTKTAAASTRESIFRATISDSGSDAFDIFNATNVNGSFAPGFSGSRFSSNLFALAFVAQTNSTNDTGTNPLMLFEARRTSSTTDPNNGTISAISTRPLFAWQNSGTERMRMLANGNLGLGTTSPSQRLHVAGDINVSSGSGYRINNTATSGTYLRGNGTRFVQSTIQAADVPTLNQSTTGNAATATTLQTARTLTIGGTGKTFNGGADVSWSLSEIGVGDGQLTLSTSGIATGSATFTANQSGNSTFTVNVPGTDLAEGTRTSTTVPLTSSTGSNATLSAATTSLAGVMSSADKTKLDGIADGATANVGTVTSIATNNGITGGTITSSGTVGLTGQALALHNLATNGLISRTGSGTVAGRTITAGTGISVTNGDGVSGNPTITNSAPDQTVVLTGAGATTISGTYPSFTISSTDTNTTYSAGNGISLSGTTFSVAAGTGLTQDTGGLSLTSITSGASTVGAVRYNGTTATAGQFYGGTTNPTQTTRLNYNGNLHSTSFVGPLSGNATTASTLETPRTINGTSFDGSAAITTSSWGTSRNITVGNTTRAVDGSTTYTWSLADIGVNNATLTLATSGIATGSQTWTANQGSAATFTVNVPGTNIAEGTRTSTTVPLTSSTGSNATLSAATTSLAGVMSSADKTKLDGIESGAQVNTVTSVAGKTGAVSLTNSDVGLGNVTNHAQVQKLASSTNGNVPTWNGTTGNQLANGYGVETTLTGGSGNLARADAIKTYVDGLLAANDAMIFKGTLGTGGTYTSLPTTHGVGWTLRVITAGTYAGNVAEVGDMYISLVSRSGSGNTNADWSVIQTNIDGAVVGPASSVNDHVALFNGTTGKLLKSAGVALGNGQLTLGATGIATVTGSAEFTANQSGNSSFVIGVPGTDLAEGTRTSTTVQLTSSTGTNATLSAATTSLAGVMSSADKTKLDGVAAGATANVGTVTSIATNNGITGGTITSSGTLGLTGQALALHNLATNGLISRTGSGTVAGRTITGTANQVTVTNGDGVSGNPTLSLPQNIHTSATPTFGATTLNGTLGLRASATSSEATHIPVFTADPSSTTRTLSTRTPAQFADDIGLGPLDSPTFAACTVSGHFAAATKSFLIDNPSGGKLQYGVSESNEHGVFVRGTSSENVIHLPNEWEWLVDENSVTVTLTPVGKFQPLCVISQNNRAIEISGCDGKYNYVIYGTRKDVKPLEVNV